MFLANSYENWQKNVFKYANIRHLNICSYIFVKFKH